jgi:hypothetical protein
MLCAPVHHPRAPAPVWDEGPASESLNMSITLDSSPRFAATPLPSATAVFVSS